MAEEQRGLLIQLELLCSLTGIHTVLILGRGLINYSRALDEREYLVIIIRDSFCYFCIKTYVVTPHLNRLEKLSVIIIKYSLLSRALNHVLLFLHLGHK